jgi:capsular polysaccharide biosynthesis protein
LSAVRRILDGGREDVRVTPISIGLERRLAAPRVAIGPDGSVERLPSELPAQSARPPVLARLDGAGVLVPPGKSRCYLLTARDELVFEALDGSGAVRKRAEGDLAAQVPEQNRVLDEDVLFAAGPRMAGYWHWWIDALPRLWLADQNLDEAGELPLPLPPKRKRFHRESMKLLGLAGRVRELEPGLTRFASVTFTEGIIGGGSRRPASALSAYAAWLRARLGLDGEGAHPGRRLYVTRSDAKTRRIVNEDDLDPILRGRGFERIECAALTLAEQIEAFSTAEIVIGPHGAGLTNLLFAPRASGLVEIFGAGAELDISNYRALASHLGIPYARLSGATAGGAERAHDRDIEVSPAGLERCLDSLGA